MSELKKFGARFQLGYIRRLDDNSFELISFNPKLPKLLVSAGHANYDFLVRETNLEIGSEYNFDFDLDLPMEKDLEIFREWDQAKSENE